MLEKMLDNKILEFLLINDSLMGHIEKLMVTLIITDKIDIDKILLMNAVEVPTNI